jgi:hypothetical protein
MAVVAVMGPPTVSVVLGVSPYSLISGGNEDFLKGYRLRLGLRGSRSYDVFDG